MVHILNILFPRLLPWESRKEMIIRISIAISPRGLQLFHYMKTLQVNLGL